jgi:3-methyladenine DNA glycosylase Mpg
MHAIGVEQPKLSNVWACGCGLCLSDLWLLHCLNVVTDADGTPGAVLIRALQLDTILWIDRQKEAKHTGLLLGHESSVVR